MANKTPQIVMVNHGYSEWFEKWEVTMHGPFDSHSDAADFAAHVMNGTINIDSVTGRIQDATVCNLNDPYVRVRNA